MTAAPAVRRFRKRPVTVEMIRWTGGSPDELEAFTWGLFRLVDPCDRAEDTEVTAEVYDKLHSTWIGVRDGQWVVKGVRGELYPLDDEVRQETYDPAGGLEGKTPGQAVYEAHQAFMIRCFPGIAPIGWDELSEEAQAGWEGIARDGIAAYIEANACDPVDARSVILEAAGLPIITVTRLAAALKGRRILVDVDDAQRTGTGDGMWLVTPSRPHDLAVQLLAAIDPRLTDDPPRSHGDIGGAS